MSQILKKLYQSLTVRIVLLIAVVLSATLLIYNAVLINQSTQIVGDVLVTEAAFSDPSACDPSEVCFDALDSDEIIEVDPAPFTPSDKDIMAIEAAANTQLRNTFLREFLLIPIVVALLAGLLIARMVTHPHRQLNSAIQKLIDNGHHAHLDKLNITELDNTIGQFNQLVDELQETESLRKDMVSDISHELRTPLTSTSVMVHGMIDGVIPKTKKQLIHMQTELQKLQATVDQFEEFVSQQKQIVQLKPEDIELKVFFNQIIGHITEQAGLDLNLDISDSLVISADKKLLTQLFTNLARNTTSYAEATSIKISATESKIIFSDNGKGVSENHLRHLFERFYRVEKSRNKEYGGLGLGLAIVKQIAERHGWGIRVKSDDGLMFTIDMVSK